MTATGIGAANSSMRSAAPRASNASIRSCASCGDAGRELLDLARDEGAVDEIPEPGVLGRLQFEKRMALERVERGEMGFGRRPAELLAAHHMEDLPAEALVAQQGGNVGMGGEAPETVILPEEDGRFGADRGVGGIRIVEEGRIARIEADAAALGVDDGSHGPDVRA